MSIHTRWITVKGTSLVTRIHYVKGSSKLLIALDDFECRNRILVWIIRRLLRLIGTWQEYRDVRTVWTVTRMLTREELTTLGLDR